jgi:hypothetical protein
METGVRVKMRAMLTVEERLIIVKALRDRFCRLLASRRPDKWNHASKVYDLANRLRREGTGRPEKVWDWTVRERPKECLKDFDKWIQDLVDETGQLQGSSKLATSLTSEKSPVSPIGSD